MAKRSSSKSAGNGNGAARTEATYFLSLSLENIRCFKEKQTLDLSDGKGRPARWTILLGNNGTGKTTVLQLLAVLAYAEALFPSPSPAGSSVSGLGARPTESSVLVDWAIRYLGLCADLLRQGVRRGEWGADLAEGALTRRGSTWRQASSWLYLSRESPQEGVGCHWETGPQHLREPRCYAYGAARRLGQSTLSGKEDDPTATLFADTTMLRDAEEWLLRLDYSASKSSPIQQRQQERLKQVQGLLVQLLPETSGVRFSSPSTEHPTPRVEFETPFGWVPLRQLGYGYQTLIAWMVDFASRMVERYPDSADPLAEPAVVLVDEIDLHLHPQWQRKLIGHLTERFPNTQFIATAHSPLVVQAAGADANLAVLRREGDQVVIDNDVDAIRGWRVDQILTSELFGLPSARPPEFDRALERRAELLQRLTLTPPEQEELAALEARVGDLPVGETARQAREFKVLRDAIDLLEKAQQPRK